jgi:hypothetical protein
MDLTTNYSKMRIASLDVACDTSNVLAVLEDKIVGDILGVFMMSSLL